MIENLITQYKRLHGHMTPNQIGWYVSKIRLAESLDIEVQKFPFWVRPWMNYYLKKISSCKDCGEAYQSELHKVN